MPEDNNPNNFNPDQLCTIEQAREFVARVNARNIGGGVAAEVADDDYHNDASGIYLPPWENPTGNQPEPQIGDARGFLMRLKPSGDKKFQAAGFNIGMSRATARNHVVDGSTTPEADWAWTYALDSLETEVNQQIAAAGE
jgi:hypothetical protein